VDAEHGGRNAASHGASHAENRGQHGDAARISRLKQLAERGEIGGATVRAAHEGSEQDDFAVCEAVEVTTLDEVFGVAVPAVVVDVEADASEPGGGDEEGGVLITQFMLVAEDIEKSSGDGGDRLGSHLVDSVGTGEAGDRGSTYIGKDGGFGAEILPDEAFAQTLASDREGSSAGHFHHLIKDDGCRMKDIGTGTTDACDLSAVGRGESGKRRCEAVDLSAAYLEAMQTPKRVFGTDTNDPGEITDRTPDANEGSTIGGYFEFLANGLAKEPYLLLGRRIRRKEAVARVEGAKWRGLGACETAALDIDEFGRTAADVEDAARVDGDAVHNAEETGVGLFLGTDDADGDSRFCRDAGDEFAGVGRSPKGLGANGHERGGAIRGGDLPREPECAEAAFHC